jgi:hypothetical protein
MEPVTALTTEYLDQRLGHLESLLIERFERRLVDTRTELLKWSILCWVGQVAAIGGMLAFALRSIGR